MEDVVFAERNVDLRVDDRQTKELKRIADRVRKIAVRDFPADKAIAVIVAVQPGEDPVVRLGVEVDVEDIEVAVDEAE